MNNPQTITKDIVHKTDAQNVFIKDISGGTGTICQASAFFPNDHCVYNDQISGINATYFIEQARQANIAICHLFHEVKLGMNFVVFNIDWKFSEGSPYVPDDLSPYTIDVEFISYKKTDAHIYVKSRCVLHQENTPFLTGGATYLITENNRDPNASDALDNFHKVSAPKASPESLQLSDDTNVLITVPEQINQGSVYRSSMCIDLTHPFYFEHPNSHVPGIMLLEAGKQMALGTLKNKLNSDLTDGVYGDLISGEITFNNFAFFDSEILLEAETGETETVNGKTLIPVTVSFIQNDKTIGALKGTGAFSDAQAIRQKSAYTLS